MKKIKRIIALFLTVCMIVSTPLSVMATETAEPQSDETFSKVLHLDNGRKYFSKDWIIALVNEMEAAGYNQLQLAFGNDGMRFLLDDMSVTVNGTTYSDDEVTAGIKQGNKNYYDAGEVNELTQAEMTEIVNYAKRKGIEVVPHMNMPGHMDAILDAIEYVGISDAHFTGYTTSARSLNLNNDAAVAFTHALMKKYVAYFDGLGCKYFHIGADEYGNDAYGSSMGFPSMGADLYAKFAKFVNDAAAIVESEGMTPRAWNDGISYGSYTDDFDKKIQITYWSNGWSGYNVAPASTLSGNDHDMINTHGSYYFILTSNGITNPNDSALEFNNNTFMGSTISDPVGSMFCIWCDDPGSATEQEVAAAVRITLRKMAAAMNGTTNYSEEVVSGGFNADGSIAETRAWNTVSPASNSAITVSGYDLTSATATEVAESDLPDVDGAAKIRAWDIIPYVNDTKYTEKGTVSLPVPEDWNTSMLKGFYVENGSAVLVKGTYADGKYTFNMPHFSVAGIAESDYDKLIELNVGESKTELINGVDLTGNTYTPDPAGIASVTTSSHTAVTGKKLEQVTSAGDLASGKQYVFVNKRSGNVLGDEVDYASTWGTYCIVQDYEALSVNSTAWTITESGTAYQIANSNGKYMTIGNNSSNLSNSSVNLTIYDYGNGTFAIGQNGYYLNDMGAGGAFAGGYGVLDDSGAPWYIYRVVDEQGTSGTDVTFTGDSAGTTFVTINNVIYKIIVHGTVDITINYKDANGNLIKTETATVADNATSYTVSNFNYEEKYYVVENTTLPLVAGTTTYDVIVTETTENLDEVNPLTIYYWITNKEVTIDGNTSQSLNAADVYTENGVSFTELVPASDEAVDNPKVLWRGWLLPDGSHQEGESTSPDMCTDSNGEVIEKIRYWNGEWAYFDGDSWTEIKATDQVNAYYVQQTEVTKEVTTNVTDWGETYEAWSDLNGNNHWFWTNYVENGSKFVFLDFAVVYEDGTQTPAEFPVDDTWFFHFEDCSETNPRVLKPVTFTETAAYEIWKVTVTDGTCEGYGSATTFTSSYDDTTETVVWDESMGGTPQLATLSYTANRSGKLIRIYVRAVETEDTLTVIYYDEKFNDTLYSYNISVKDGVNFNNGIDPIPGAFTYPEDYTGQQEERIDVTGSSVENALGKSQSLQTDLTLVPEAVGKYNNALYSYTGSEISDDGKTLYLYYNINTTVLSPMFVADFGRPFTFSLSQIVGEGQIDLVDDVNVNKNTRYGTLEYNATDKIFTYTPTQVLQNIDVLTINIKFDGNSSFTTTNSGVLPASTVNYEEDFATLSGFTGGSTNASMQTMQIAGQSSDAYGFDAEVAKDENVAAVSTTKGDTATFTFTGRGVDLYVNSKANTGTIAVQVRDASDKLVKVYSVKTPSYSTITGDFSNTEQNGLVAVSLMGLAYGQYSVKVTTTTPDAGIYFDGFRVYGTVENHANDYYVDDNEDNATFVELRNEVLTGINVDTTVSDYYDKNAGKIYEQLYKESGNLNGGLVLSSNSEFDKTDLLDNGPKNELFLLPGDVVTFNLGSTTAQIGMKAVGGDAKYVLNNDTQNEKTISTNTDMFYEDGVTGAVTIKNTGDAILSITQLKIFDVAEPAEEFAFEALSEEQITFALRSMAGVPTADPDTPAEPETPVEPETPEEPTPGTPDEPTQEPEHECTIEEEIVPATTMKAGKIINKCKECGEVESTKIIYKASNVKLANKEFVYNGKVKAPKLIVKDSKGKVIDKKYYTVTKPAGRKNVGKYTYTIKFKGLYEGTKKLTLTVKPKATAVKSVTASKKAFTVKWKKVSKQATGYEIMYATNAKFSKGKHTVTVKNFKTTSKKISKLKAKQKYYVKVRTYKTVKVNGKNTKIYSNWSKYRTVTTKR